MFRGSTGEPCSESANVGYGLLGQSSACPLTDRLQEIADFGLP